jgi:hypothetical protein
MCARLKQISLGVGLGAHEGANSATHDFCGKETDHRGPEGTMGEMADTTLT